LTKNWNGFDAAYHLVGNDAAGVRLMVAGIAEWGPVLPTPWGAGIAPMGVLPAGLRFVFIWSDASCGGLPSWARDWRGGHVGSRA
jgi:hypothetical protein